MAHGRSAPHDHDDDNDDHDHDHDHDHDDDDDEDDDDDDEDDDGGGANNIIVSKTRPKALFEDVSSETRTSDRTC